MSSTQEAGSSGVSGRKKKGDGTRRSWTHNEEAVLIASLKEIVATGWRSENGFRVGYLKKLEDALKVHFPNTDLRAYPHINSKIAIWKRNYSALCAILSRSGVRFNARGNHMIDAEEDTWESLKKVVANINSIRLKMWPYLDDWKEIFGEDRATGEGAEDIADAWTDIQAEENIQNLGTGEDYNVMVEDDPDQVGAAESVSHTQKGPAPASKNYKKRKNTDDASAVSALCDILAEFGRKTDERLASLADSIAYDARLGQTCEDAFEQLSNIAGLNEDQRFDVCEILSANLDKVRIFKGLPASARPQYMKRLLAINGRP